MDKTVELAARLITGSVFLRGDGLTAFFILVALILILGVIWWRTGFLGDRHPAAMGGLLLLVGLGTSITGICGYWLIHEWHWLNTSYDLYNRTTLDTRSTVRDLMVADSLQVAHRVNCLGEALGALIGMVLSAIGVHGLAVTSPTPESETIT